MCVYGEKYFVVLDIIVSRERDVALVTTITILHTAGEISLLFGLIRLGGTHRMISSDI